MSQRQVTLAMTKDLGIKNEAAMVQVFSQMLNNVHPLAIGSLYRSSSLIRFIAKKLLLKHIDASENERITHIIDNLTRKFSSHSYMISRSEAAKSVKLPVTFCSEQLERKLMELYYIYENDLCLDKPFIPELSANNEGRFNVSSGIIESSNRTDEYVFEGIIEQKVDINIINQDWQQIRGGF